MFWRLLVLKLLVTLVLLALLTHEGVAVTSQSGKMVTICHYCFRCFWCKAVTVLRALMNAIFILKLSATNNCENQYSALYSAPSLSCHTGETHGDNRQERKTETYWMRFWENIINISQLMQISGSYTGAESHYNMMEIFSLLCIAADSRLGWATLPCRSLWWSRRLHTRGGGEKWSENNSDILKKYMVRLTSLVFREECIMTACQHLASPTF